MGVLKNDVGRPSKKTKIIRGVLKLEDQVRKQK